MLALERLWHDQNRTVVLAASGVIVLVVAVADWWTKEFVSLGLLYLFPIMFVAAFLPRWLVAAIGAVCAGLTEAFDGLEPSLIRLIFETAAFVGGGLFVGELARNRKITLESQARLKVLVETSPAAILTVDERGFIELANRAAVQLMAPRDGVLVGHPIAGYLPELHHALRWEDAPQFRTAMQCRGHRGNGDSFSAEVWFSTYKEGYRPKLAAIIADLTEDAAATTSSVSPFGSGDRAALSEREIAVLRLVVQGFANKEIAAKMLISESIVKNTIQQLFAKTGVRTRGQLVRVALEQYRGEL